ncbi:4504_t:CDS:10 [Entrophospora sp. SA101]|nr:4504_t:CDS:10 [Entrophospora sp. SA101]
MYRVATVKIEVEVWDPYEVLGLSEVNVQLIIRKKLIKKHYKELTPSDKKDEYEKTFIDFTKAYKVLTDDDIPYSLGIALPTWLVESKNSPFVLGIYGIVFGLLLPYYVGSWWYSSNSYTKDRIRTHTMDLYFKELRQNTSFKQILELLSASVEFMELVEQRSSDNALITTVISSVKEDLEKRFSDKYLTSKKYIAPYSQKANALTYSHLLRIDIKDKNLLKDRYFIIERSVHLVNGLLEIALAHRWLQTTIRCMELSQLLVQAMWINDNPLIQLPYITIDVLKAMKIKKKVIRNIGQFRNMNEEERRNLLKSLSDLEYGTVLHVANSYPILEIVQAVFKVTGDDIITPGSIVTCILKVKLAGTKAVSKNINNVKNNKSNKTQDELLFGSSKRKEIKEKSDFVHAPYLARDKKPYWWIFMADEKHDRIIIEPVKVTDIVTKRTFKFQFQAPREPGLYSFTFYFKSDSYFGADIKKDMKLDVKDFSELPPQEEVDDDISEPEEDSLAAKKSGGDSDDSDDSDGDGDSSDDD